MPIIFETCRINQDRYSKLIKRQLQINLGYHETQKTLKNWNIVVYPLEASVDFDDFFDHVEGETNIGIAWGVTMPKGADGGDIFLFVNDTSNPFLLLSNFTKISHELGHCILYIKRGRGRCIRRYDDPGARKGTEGPCYVTLVHDQFYGRKKFRKYWIRFGVMWLPVKMLDIWDILH